MPLKWMQALEQPNGQPFLAANLSRFGYLPNEASIPPGLPIGFNVASLGGVRQIGMTCSACHTRQIEVAGASYRIDGGPAIVDVQGFFAGLDAAVGAVLANKRAFTDFAAAVLGANPPPDEQATLRKEVEAWYLRYHTLMKGLPVKPWGPGRVDAIAIIFNRLTGLDIGPEPDNLIEENIHLGTAPARYPFLWNAPIQDKTQWAGFANNGNSDLALSRNLGEVYGVFGTFTPKKDPKRWLGIDFLVNNSANFKGLRALEDLVRKIGPPKWRWNVNAKLAAQGRDIFARTEKQGGCISCHGIKTDETQPPDKRTWKTPVLDVGTDSKQYSILGWTAKTGVLKGAGIPSKENLKEEDTAYNVLILSVFGSIFQDSLRTKKSDAQVDSETTETSPFTPETEALKDAFRQPAKDAAPSFPYEARVLEGIWAAAPYLHNGSVPTLAELLKPAADRVVSFKIGPAYDVENVGLAVKQTKFDYELQTTDCKERDSGNSRCGHEYGTTTLTKDEKKALLEYLKTL